MNHLQTPVEMRITFNSTATGPVGATLRFTDRMSNRVVFEVNITGQEFTELLASRAAYAMADLLPKEFYHLVGMREENYKLTDEDYPAGWADNWRRQYDKDPFNKYGYLPPQNLKAFAQAYITKNGWDSYEWRFHNYGWDMIVRRHVEATDGEREARLDPHNW